MFGKAQNSGVNHGPKMSGSRKSQYGGYRSAVSMPRQFSYISDYYDVLMKNIFERIMEFREKNQEEASFLELSC